MPEIKHEFSAGKMNKDLDERLVPNGEYRDAMNIQVRTTGSEDGAGNAGTVQNLKGNRAVFESIYYGSSYWQTSANDSRFVGSVSEEKNNAAYFFISSSNLNDEIQAVNYGSAQGFGPTESKKFIDAIVRVKSTDSNPLCEPIVVDYYGIISPPSDVLSSSAATSSGGWMNLAVINSADYREGMTVKALDSNGNNLLNERAEIQHVLGNSIKFYDPQPDITWANVKAFIFEAPRVLKFKKENYITGINILDDFLIWTDNNTEPKKINIKRCKEGTPSFTSHTQLKLTDPIDSDILVDFTESNASSEDSNSPPTNNDLKEEHITVIRKAPLMAPTIHMKETDRELPIDVEGFYSEMFAEYGSTLEQIPLGTQVIIPTDEDIEAFEADQNDAPYDVTIFNGVDWRVNDILTFTEDTGIDGSFFTATVDGVEDDGDYKRFTITILTINQQLLPVNLDLNGDPVINGSGTWNITLEDRDPLFELVFCRFSTRYRYEDGEVTNFGPWSEIAFIPGSFDFSHKKGYNLGMTNRMRKLSIRNIIPNQRIRSNDMVAVDVLYKTTHSPKVYLVKTITKGVDPEWDRFVPADGNAGNSQLYFGELNITSELITKILPDMQTLRAWDNVPINALGQEVAANRLIYANYTQGYEVENLVELKQNLKSDSNATSSDPKKSVKSIRDYKFGMILGDEYGRETPVISPGFITDSDTDTVIEDGNVRVPKTLSAKRNTFELTQRWDQSDDGEPDSWISYVKYYIKETTNEYYNVVMDRWYEAEDGNIWISFSSADRNKIDEDTYLILKNEHGVDKAVLEKARYRVIAIQNEAPDFIKSQARSMGSVKMLTEQQGYSLEYMFSNNNPSYADALSQSPLALMEGDAMAIHPDFWNDFLGGYENPKGDLEVRITAESGGFAVKSTAWRLVTYHHVGEDDDGTDGVGAIRWDKPFGEHADMYDRLVSQVGSSPLDSIEYGLEFREMVLKNQPEFDGKFFVKIERDAVLQQKVLQMTGESIDYDVELSVPIAYIENSTYNPSALFSVNAGVNPVTGVDPMPRRAYRWQDNNPSNTRSFTYLDYDSDGNQITTTETLTVGAGESYNEGNVGTTNVSGINPSYVSALADDGQMGGCRGTSADHGWNTSNGLYEDDGGGGADSVGDGCHPEDAEVLALGCWDDDGNTELENWFVPNFGTWSSPPEYWAQEDVVETNLTTTIYNRTAETYDFWLFWRGYYGFDFIDGGHVMHGASCFIDGMRTAHTLYGDQEANWWDEGDGTSVGDGQYYKPTGMEPGYLSSSIVTSDAFGPTVDGELGRMTISVNPDAVNGYDFNSTPGSDEFEIKNRFTSYGTLFRFERDPNPANVYQVVSRSSEVDHFKMYNHNLVPYELDGSDEAYPGYQFSSDIWSDFSEYVPRWRWQNPLYGESDPGSSWVDIYRPDDGFGTVGWTNRDPIPYSGMTGEAISTSAIAIAGGFNNDGSPGSPPAYNKKVCFRCGDGYPDDGTFNYNDYPNGPSTDTCRRVGFRFEFRRYDTSENKLLDGGTRGIDTQEWDPRGAICHDGREAMRISFLKRSITMGEVVIPVADAGVWETEPKENVDIDIFYEASNAIPTRLTSENTQNFVPFKSKVNVKSFSGDSFTNGSYTDVTIGGGSTVWEENSLYVQWIGYTTTNSVIGINGIKQVGTNLVHSPYIETQGDELINVGDFLQFEHPDGTKTMSRVVSYMIPVNLDGTNMTPQVNSIGVVNWLDSNGDQGLSWQHETRFKETDQSTGFFKIDSEVWKFPIELSWHNCWTFGNGVESDRIRDDFNAPQLDNGVKVSTTLLDYGRERRGSGMLYSGIYNSTSGVNKLNEFNMADKITKDINPSYGSIQRLKTRDTDIVIFAEDKILRAVTNKDALYKADGNPQLLASNRVLGTAVPYAGDYGISQNPESLAWDSYRLYFTDVQRGAVLRLSMDGVTPISNVGMKTWFRDNLPKAQRLLGTFDGVNGEYNLTLDQYTGAGDGLDPNSVTVAFNEGSKGWVSFRSFVPEVGEYVGGKYFTAISRSLNSSSPKKGIFEHHVDEVNTSGDIINRNVFYATEESIGCEGETSVASGCNNVPNVNNYFKESSIDILFNDAPSSIKAFRAVNYEGSQAKINKYVSETGIDWAGNEYTLTDGEYYNLSDKFGWWVENITTDNTNSGKVVDFKNKEGKWYQHITSDERQFSEIEGSLSDFSVQGLGTAIANPIEEEEEETQNITIEIINLDDNE